MSAPKKAERQPPPDWPTEAGITTAWAVVDPDGEVVLSGIAGEAIIRRDRLGVPYIEAGSEQDLFFATGYATASDRLWQMTGNSLGPQRQPAQDAEHEVRPRYRVSAMPARIIQVRAG